MDLHRPTFLDARRWTDRVFISDWSRTEAGTIEVLNPATGEKLASVGNGAPADVRRAALEATEVQKEWAKSPAISKGNVLNRAADILEGNKQELGNWIKKETGSVHLKAMVEIEHAARYLRHGAQLAGLPTGVLLPTTDGRTNLARRIPHGVVGVISPFNFPLVLSVRAIAAALGLGNAVVHKPDPRTPVTGGIMIARLFEEAGLPAGLLHVIPGGADVGEAICCDPHISMISFTGSVGGGMRVGELCGRHLKRVQLELGGKNALIILDDADIDIAASNAAWGTFLHQGQICMATGLVLVDQKIESEFIDRLVARAAKLSCGDPSTSDCLLGPLISDAQVASVEEIIIDAVLKGAKIAAGGSHSGRFFEATVLTGVKPGMRAFEEEIFGPVACIASFQTDQEAVELANGSDFGLAAGVISRDVGRATYLGNQLNVGQLHINDQTVNGNPEAPFGGRGKSGNGTRVGGPADVEEFTQWQWVTIKETASAYPF